MRNALLIAASLLIATPRISAQTSAQKESILLNATAVASPASITLSWPSQSGTTGYSIYRKLKSDASWTSIGSAGAGATTYQDNSVSTATYYEYKVVRAYSGGTGYGYIAAGIQVPATDYRGKLVLLVDNTFVSAAASQLTQLETDLKADGWTVVRSNVDRSASASSVRSVIQGYYNADPTNVKAVYIIGHVAVPYSGNLNPDGHGDHLGAWPCDGYYGEMNSSWSDNSVSSSGAQNARNHNVPGDGSLDQNDFPSDLELQVGRVDFYEFESFQYYAGLSETQLLINYLDKAHQFKTKQFTPTYRGAVFNNFDDMPNAFAGSGYRSISACVGNANLSDLDPNGAAFKTYVAGQSWLWSYACGGGSWVSGDNIATTGDYASSVSMGSVFNMTFGSYFGDWNSFNDFLKAPLGSGKALTNVWAGIPNWWFHHMAMGDNIGYSARISMNNTTLYVPQNPGWQGSPYNRVHMGLMGDPSLRQVMVPMPGSLTVANNGGIASFSWGAASGVDGYYIYDMGATGAAPVRITPSVVTGTSFTSATVPFVSGRQYMVRAVKMETAATGTYQNLSLGVFATASGATADCLGVSGGSATVGSTCNDNNACTINDVYNANCVCTGTNNTPTASVTAGGATSFCSGGSVALNASTGTGYSYQWKNNGTAISGATGSSYTATAAGSYTVTVSNGSCSATSAATTVSVTSAPGATVTAGGATSFCSGGSVVLNANTGTGYSYQWKNNGTAISGATGSSYTASAAGSYSVTVSNGGCAATSAATTVNVTAAPTATVTAGGATSFCTGGSVALNASTGTGYSYQWKNNGTAINGATGSSYTAAAAGSYTVTVSNGSCSATSAATTVNVTSAPAATVTAGGVTSFCSGGSVVLNANTGTGYSYQWKNNGTAISGATTSSYSATGAGSYSVTVSNGGCSATSASTTVSVTAGPTATVTAAGATSFCSGGSVALNATTGTGYSYQWNKNGTAISGATSSVYSANATGSYSVTVSNGGSCSSTSAATSVTVGTVPTAAITASGATSFCSGGSVVLNASTGTGYSYQWKNNGTAISGATNSSYSATTAGSFTVTVSNNGCSATSSATATTIVAAPTVSTSANSTNATVTASVTGGSSPYTYSWNTIPAQTSATATVNASGTYTVTVTGANGCSTTSSVTISLASSGTCDGIHTETQASWGAAAVIGNAAAYRDWHFASAFMPPNYLTIGCGSRTLRLTNAARVNDFLPSSGPAGQLPSGMMQDPGSSYGNSLAGELVALKLAVRFDELNPDFSPSTVLLKDMVIASGTFAGWTVAELIDYADSKIGGCGGWISRTTLATALAAVNNGYAGGTMSSGYLQCPAAAHSMMSSVPDEESGAITSSASELAVSLAPNPFHGSTSIRIEGATSEAPVNVEIWSPDGRLVAHMALSGKEGEVVRTAQWETGDLRAGLYLLRAVCGDRIAIARPVVY